MHKYQKIADDNSPFHIQDDVENLLFARFKWDAAFYFPDCTYLTNSAAWAYGDGPYHQNVKPGTLVGLERRNARTLAINHVIRLWNSREFIPKICIENPRGVLSTYFRKPDIEVHPYWFGDDASKLTCFWKYGFEFDDIPSGEWWAKPRMVNGKPRWGNQTDSGQNRETPGDDRVAIRAKTFPGIALWLATSIDR